MTRTGLSGCAALWVLAWASGASGAAAQQAERPLDDQRVTQIDEIVVTAQRRTQNLQDVPMSVTSISQETLTQSGVVGSEDLTLITPGLNFSRSSVNAQPTIRGIGTRNAGPGDEPNVASYIDGVYQAEQFNNFQEFTNIERIEVLKGPQGTLFGRNATGGAINVITRRPSFTPDAQVGFTSGSFNYAKATLHATGPLIEDLLAGSISAYAISEDSYYDNLFLGTKNGDNQAMAGRLKLLFTPNERMSFGLNAAYAFSDNSLTRAGTPINGNSSARTRANPTNIPIDILIPTRPWTTSVDVIPGSAVRQKLIDAHMDMDLGWANLTGLASYSRSSNVQAHDDFDMSPLPISDIRPNFQNHATNQELVLSSTTDGPFEWMVGATAFQAEADVTTFSYSGATGTTVRTGGVPNGQDTSGYAAFVEGTYNLFDNLFLTAGVRYSHDEKEAFNGPNPAGVRIDGKDEWSNWAPRVVARYEFAENSNVYVSYTEGFKTGAFAPATVAGAATPAEPEEVSAYEIGLKTQLFSAVRLNVAVFQSDYTNLQASLNILQPNGVVTPILENAKEATIRGLEATADWYVTSALRLNAGVSLLDTEIGDFTNASAFQPILVNGLPSGNMSVTADVTGNELIRSPNWTVNLGANYTTSLSGGDLTLAANAFFSDSYYADLINRVEQPAYEVLNLSATYTFANSGVSVSAFVNNVTDEEYAMSFTSSAFGDTVQLSKPRWGGVTVGYRF